MGSEWSSAALRELVDISTEKMVTSGIPKESYVSTDNMVPDFGGVAFNDSLPSVAKISRFSKDDILFSNIRTYFRKLWIADRDGGCSNDVIVFRTKKHLSPKFLFYSLMDERFIKHTVQTSKGTKMPRGDKSAILQYEVTLPPLPEQKAIAHILGTLDDKIELNRRMNATLEGMAQALFKSWFVDFDPVIDNAIKAGNPIPDELTDRAEVRRQALSDKRISTTQQGSVDEPTLSDRKSLFPAGFQFTEELGWIPEGWEATTVSEAIRVNPSTKLKKGDLAPFADMKALPTSGYAISGVIEKAYSGGTKFQNGDVLLARITPCIENGKTGVVDFLTEDDPVGFGSTEFIVLRGDGDLSTAFIACLARDSNFRKHCEQSMIGSSGRQRVHNSCFDSYHLALPKNREVVSQFNALAVPSFAKATSQSNESKTLENLRDILLPELISGELSTLKH